MLPIEASTVVVGAGLLGLATADHLLRRGEERVLLLERAGSPNAGRPGAVWPILRQGSLDRDDAENRGRLLLASGDEYLDTYDLREGDGLRRIGSLRIPAEDAVPFEAERLTAEEVASRLPALVEAPDGARFSPGDGTIDTLPLLSALYDRVRQQGARFLFDAELLTVREEGDRVHFTAGARSGSAERLLLTAGDRSLPFLETLGCRHPWRREAVHSFTVEREDRTGPVVWLPERRAVIFPLPDGVWEVAIAIDAPSSADLTVDWTLLEALRRDEAERVPWLSAAPVRRARVEARLGDDLGDPIVTSRGGKILAAGAMGDHGIGLFPAISETLVERALASGDEGGILEDFDADE